MPVLRGNGTKIAPTGDIFDQPSGELSWIRGKLADHVGDHVVLFPEEGVLVTSPRTESSSPRLPQSLNNSQIKPEIGDTQGKQAEVAPSIQVHVLLVRLATEWVQQSHSASAESLITSSLPNLLLTHARPSPLCSLSAAVPRD